MTPLRFLHDLIERARPQRRHIVLPEGTDVRILRAAEILHRRDVCDLTLLGRESDVRELAASQGIDLVRDQHRGPGHLGTAPGVRRKVRRAAGAQGRGPGQGPGDHAGRKLLRHHDGPAGRGGRHGLRRRAHHRPHHPAGAGIREDPRGREDRVLGVPDADAGPRAGLRRLRREPGPQRGTAGGHRPGLGRNGGPVRRGAAGGHAVLLHRRLRLRRGRGRSPAGHRTGARPPPGSRRRRPHPVRRRRGRRRSPSPRCRARPWPGRRPCSSSRT